MNQVQPFPTAPIKASLVQRLIGDGWIRFDPVTGNYFEVEKNGPRFKTRLATPHECSGGCGRILYRSPRQVRKYGRPRCKHCPHQASLPIGSRRRNPGGYIEIKTAMVPKTWELEHRVVMEQALGRELHDSETVHHINGQRDDNRLDNLQLRQGQHGAGIAMHCADCGSYNVVASPLAGGGPPTQRF